MAISFFGFDIYYLVYIFIFGVASFACFLSLIRARKIDKKDIRLGISSLVFLSGIWSLSNALFIFSSTNQSRLFFYYIGLIVGLAAVGPWLYFCSAYTGRTLHLEKKYRVAAVVIFIGITIIKLTNPIHGLYFTTEFITDPFPHLSIDNGVLHWTVMGFSYTLAAIGYFMLFEFFRKVGQNTKPLTILVLITPLPLFLDIIGFVTNPILNINYEPIGVAVFAVGVLFFFLTEFQAVQISGETENPVIFLDEKNQIKEFSEKAKNKFPKLKNSYGKPIQKPIPELKDIITEKTNKNVFVIENKDVKNYFSVSINPFTFGKTQIGKILIIEDITQQKKYEKELENKNKQLSVLNRVLRHDIRNDMNVINMWGEMLQNKINSKGSEELERILKSSKHVIELTEISRDLTETIEEKQLETEPIEIKSYLLNEIEKKKATFENVEFYIEEEIPETKVEANKMISSVFRNILNNAIVHNDKKTPKITVSTEKTDNSYIISISDNGPGISDEMKEKIFDIKEKGIDSEGTGIGLYLVKTLIDSYNGDVWIEDNKPEGTIFKIKLQKS